MTITQRFHDWFRPGSLLAMIFGAASMLTVGLWGDDALRRLDYALWPVSTARVTHIHRAGDEVRFHILVVRRRAECHLTGAFAYGITPEGFQLKANAARVDGDVPRDLPVGVEIDIGEWRAWPVAGSSKMVVYVHHICRGEPVSTKLIEVPV